MKELSVTWRVHVPLALSPVNTDIGCSGENLPLNGAWATVTLWTELGPASSSWVLQKLLPLLPAPPAALKSVAVRPLGEISLNDRSPTHEWSTPTVVEPTFASQLVPSM